MGNVNRSAIASVQERLAPFGLSIASDFGLAELERVAFHARAKVLPVACGGRSASCMLPSRSSWSLDQDITARRRSLSRAQTPPHASFAFVVRAPRVRAAGGSSGHGWRSFERGARSQRGASGWARKHWHARAAVVRGGDRPRARMARAPPDRCWVAPSLHTASAPRCVDRRGPAGGHRHGWLRSGIGAQATRCRDLRDPPGRLPARRAARPAGRRGRPHRAGGRSGRTCTRRRARAIAPGAGSSR